MEWDAVKRHTYQLWPFTRDLIKKLAASQMLTLHVCREVPLVGAFAENVIVVQEYDDEGRLLGRCLHEIVESVIIRGDYPEMLTTRDARIPHQIAEIVERRFLSAYRFHVAQVEHDTLRHAGIR